MSVKVKFDKGRGILVVLVVESGTVIKIEGSLGMTIGVRVDFKGNVVVDAGEKSHATFVLKNRDDRSTLDENCLLQVLKLNMAPGAGAFLSDSSVCVVPEIASRK